MSGDVSTQQKSGSLEMCLGKQDTGGASSEEVLAPPGKPAEVNLGLGQNQRRSRSQE